MNQAAQGKQGMGAMAEPGNVNALGMSMPPEEQHEWMKCTEQNRAHDVVVVACTFHTASGFEIDGPAFEWFKTK